VSALPFSALLAGGLLMLPRTGRAARATAAAATACLLALAVLTWRQTTVWHDSERLWAHALSTGHPGYTAHLNYGQALRANGRIDDAVAEYRQALIIRPDAGNAWYNLANALKASARDGEAEHAYLTAIRYLQWKVDAQVNLGNLYFAQHRLGDAIDEYRAATTTLDHAAPADFSPEPYLYLGIALSDSGNRDSALQAFAVALRYPATRRQAQQELDRLAQKARPSG
jgi:tetratricopeptide (TPR) repeat protein